MNDGKYTCTQVTFGAVPRFRSPAPARIGVVKCPSTDCPETTEATPDVFRAYFRDGHLDCWKCKTKIDWWKACLDHVQRNIMWLGVLPLLDARSLDGKAFILPPSRTVEVKLDDLGVPTTAEVLYASVWLEIQGHNPVVLPALMQGNDMQFDPFPRTLYIHGAGTPPPGTPPTWASVFVCYVDLADSPVSTHQLADAARMLLAERYAALLVPANAAAEAALTPAVELAVRGFAGRENAKRFLTDAATYSHQLNILVPMVTHMLGLRPFPDDIRGTLNRLRNLRNDVAHRGQPGREVHKKEAAAFLAAAAFGYHFARYLHDEIALAQKTHRLPALPT